MVLPSPKQAAAKYFLSNIVTSAMGYTEIACQLYGVSFAIARLRRPDEPPESCMGLWRV